MAANAPWRSALLVAGLFACQMQSQAEESSESETTAESPPETAADPSTQEESSAPDEPQAQQPDLTAEVYRVEIGDAPSLGPRAALVTIILFGDYGSGSTRSSDRVIRDFVRIRPDVRYVWKHGQTPSPDSRRAAALAEAAHRAGKFWELHPRLIDGKLDLESLRQAARAVLATEKAAAALAGSIPERVQADHRQARELGVTVEPAIFINGRLLTRAVSVERLLELIEEASAAGDRVARAGVPPRDVYKRLIADGITPKAPDPAGGLVVQGLAVGPSESPHRVEPGAGPSFGGGASAPVQLVWFGDLRCPFTAKQAEVLQALAGKRKRDIRVTFRHLPLDIHTDAGLAHRAAVAAGAQGAFWRFARRALVHPGQLDRAAVLQMATEERLDLARFQSDLDSPRTAERIEQDRAYARKLVKDMTPPTLFINGIRLTTAAPLPILEQLVDEAIRARTAQRSAHRGGKT
jgi:protein-disulfide isomerase